MSRFESPEFKDLRITELHPTFGAEVSGIDFSQPIPDSTFQQIRGASAKVQSSQNAKRYYC